MPKVNWVRLFSLSSVPFCVQYLNIQWSWAGKLSLPGEYSIHEAIKSFSFWPSELGVCGMGGIETHILVNAITTG